MSTVLGALEKQVDMLKSLLLSRYSVRQQLELGDSHGLRCKRTVIASEDAMFQDPNSVVVVDAKSLFDVSAASEQSQGDCDRTALEVAIIQDSLSQCLRSPVA